MNTFEVRDMRHKEKFFVDDSYLNGYAKHLGTTNSMVYFVLCRHADKHQECFPSYEHMADKLGVSEATIKRGIRTLCEWNIIAIGKRKRAGGKFLHNSYTLLDKSVWQNKPEVTNDLRSPEVTGEPHQRSPMHSTTGHPRPDKDTHKKEAHIKDTHLISETIVSQDIPLLIEEFKIVNPSYGKWFGNTTQRGACERMLSVHGFDYLKKIIALLPKTNRTQYMPTITTPLMLEDKMAQLVSGLEKIKNTKPKYRVI